MNLRKYTIIGRLAALAAGWALLVPMQATASEQGVEELTRGPVHEAFAATASSDPEAGMFVRTAPPSPIEEVPPEQQLEGNNVTWIPGYWGWDEETTDFIWISGVWRNLPPGRQWVPGYWAEAGNQWQWTSGYWADEEAKEVAYLPKPPKSIESGPNVEAPSRNHIWVSGTWVNREDHYAWRPGYWEPGQENWTWIPAHYQWTPRGYVFIDGYWDYDVARRGVVFAPVRFEHSYYDRPNYIYTPLMVISLNVFVNHLFVRPSYGHYYFGDYYEPRYRNEGFYASCNYRSGRNGYDPIYAHSRWEHRDDRDWERNRRENFDYYRDNQDARPPRTWAALEARPEGKRRGQRDDDQLAMPLKQYAERPNGGQRFQAVSAESRTKIVEQNKEVRKFGKDRRQMETHADAPAAFVEGKKIEAKHEKFMTSPVVAKPADQLSGKDAPPKRRGMKTGDLPADKTASPDGTTPNTNDATKNAMPPTKGHRDHNAAADQGRGKKAVEETGKMTDPTAPNTEKNDARSSKKTDTTLSPQTEPGSKRQRSDRTQAEPKTLEGKGSQPDTNPKRPNTDVAQPPKQVMPSETKRRLPTPENAVSEPTRKAEPKPAQNAAPERHQPKAQPDPQREVQPQRSPEPERRMQKAQPEPQRSAEPERRSQRAQPEPQRQAPAPQQPKGERTPGASKKGTDAEIDPTSSHRRN